MNRLRLVLHAATVLFLVTSLVMLFVTPPLDDGSPGSFRGYGADDSARGTASSARHSGAEAVSAIARGNVFSPTRTGPAVATASTGSVESERARRTGGAVPVLFGTISTPDGGAALLQFPGNPEPRMIAVGESAGGWRLVRVEERAALVDGPGGTRRLTMRAPGTQP